MNTASVIKSLATTALACAAVATQASVLQGTLTGIAVDDDNHPVTASFWFDAGNPRLFSDTQAWLQTPTSTVLFLAAASQVDLFRFNVSLDGHHYSYGSTAQDYSIYSNYLGPASGLSFVSQDNNQWLGLSLVGSVLGGATPDTAQPGAVDLDQSFLWFYDRAQGAGAFDVKLTSVTFSSPVPEPASFGLVLIGLLGVAATARRASARA